VIYLLFDKADAPALTKAAADARSNGISASQAVLFDRAAKAAENGQVLTMSGGSVADGEEIATRFTDFGLKKPRVEVR